MKKLLFLLFMIGLSISAFSQLKSNQLIGSWKYKVDTDSETYTGFLNFMHNDGALVVKTITADGYEMETVKAKIKENNTVYFELNSDNGLIKVNLKVDKNTYKGITELEGIEYPISGEKIVEP